MSEFWQLYRHPDWQRKRLQVMESANFTCERCGSKDNTLNVHHKVYFKNHKPWEYENDQLECLCDSCHEVTHKLRDELKMAISSLPLHKFEMLLGYAKALTVEDDPSATITVGSYEQAIGVAHACSFRDSVSAPSWVINVATGGGTVSGYDLMNLWVEKHGEDKQ